MLGSVNRPGGGRGVACRNQQLNSTVSSAITSKPSGRHAFLSSGTAGNRQHPQNREKPLEMDGQTECRAGRFVHGLAQSRMGMNGCFDLFKRSFEGDGQTEGARELFGPIIAMTISLAKVGSPNYHDPKWVSSPLCSSTQRIGEV